jgi:hypothetical protein
MLKHFLYFGLVLGRFLVSLRGSSLQNEKINKSSEICKEILTEWPEYNRFLFELNKTSSPNRCAERNYGEKACGFERVMSVCRPVRLLLCPVYDVPECR